MPSRAIQYPSPWTIVCELPSLTSFHAFALGDFNEPKRPGCRAYRFIAVQTYGKRGGRRAVLTYTSMSDADPAVLATNWKA